MVYGCRKLRDNLCDQGESISENHVHALRHLPISLSGVSYRRRPDRYGAVATKKLEQQFSVSRPDQVTSPVSKLSKTGCTHVLPSICSRDVWWDCQRNPV
jgi:hypothetical protein